jgi:4-amino-4-deoxy-L-arabinose transferase-like glycosyltransferase
MAAHIARELGGSRFARWLAALAVFSSPLFLRPGNLLQPVVFDQLWWTLALYSALRVETTGNHRWWLATGAALGMGLLTKFSVAFIAVPLAVGIALSPMRRWLRTPWPWAAATLAVGIGLPSITGQLLLQWPVVGQMSTLQESQLAHVTPLAFFSSQLLFSPFVLVALPAIGLLVRRGGARAVGIACAGAFVLLFLVHGKAYYVGPIYPTLFAAGAVLIDLVRPRAAVTGVRALCVAVLIAFGVLVAPFSVPIVPPTPMARYAAWSGITQTVRNNQGEVLELPQDYADMLGWEELVQRVAAVYHALPAEDRARTVIVGQNYGRAGAVDFYARKYGIPKSISSTGSYWFFGPGDLPGEIVISVGSDPEDLHQFFESVEPASHVLNPRGVPEERDFMIWICRRPLPGMTLQKIWPSLAGQN